MSLTLTLTGTGGAQGGSGMGLRVRGLRQSAALAAVSPPAMQRRSEV